MSKVTIAAMVVAKKDCVNSVKEEMLRMIEPTRQEAGCIEYRLHQDKLEPALFLFYENWESTAHLESHLNSPHYKNYVAAIANQLVDKVVHKMIEISQ